MPSTRLNVAQLRRPAAVNAAQYWLAPERFARSCAGLGDRFQVPMPATGPWLCLTHPDDLKAVFTADTGVLRLGAALAKASAHHLVLGPTGLTNVDGEEHERRRRVQQPAFHGQALAGYEATMQRKAEAVVAAWPYGTLTPALPQMQAISLEVMIATVFGVTEPARVQRLRETTLALLAEGASRRFFLQTAIASSRSQGWDRPFPRMQRLVAAMDAVVKEEIAQRRAADANPGADVLGMLMSATDTDAATMSDDELCDTMRTLVLGGHDTTASTMSWVLELLARHPDVLARLEEAVANDDDTYVEAVINEAIRLRPAFPLTARLAAQDFDLPGLTIPAGTMVVPYITLVHRRPDLYDEPLAFRPERFLDNRPATYAWIPFGGGRRRCLGAAFSLMEARVVLKTIVQRAHIQPARRRVERVGRSTVLIVPAHGAPITLHRRRNTPQSTPEARVSPAI